MSSPVPFLQRPPPDPNHFDTDPRVFINPESDLPSYVDDDRVLWEWQSTTRCWFPVINATTLESQQQAYEEGVNTKQHYQTSSGWKENHGENETGMEVELEKPEEKEESMSLNLKRKLERKKFLEAQKKSKPPPDSPATTSIYLSNLPPSLTLPDLVTLCSKYGVLAVDKTNAPKAKLYTHPDGSLKGDALVTYYKPASVDLAVQFLHETSMDGCLIQVAPAEFKGNTQTHRMKRVDPLERKLGWTGQEDVRQVAGLEKPGVGKKYLKSVVLKHMFTVAELQADPSLILDIKEEIRDECSKLGVVTNLILYDTEPEGVVVVKFKDERSASACIKLMNGRYYGGQCVEAHHLDPRTRYGVAPSNEEKDATRLQKYEAWLESNDTSQEKES